MMGRRRDSHRRHRELTDRQAMDLLGWVGDEFESDEDRRAAWEEHGPRMLEDRGGLPGSRPAAFWDYSPGAPDPDDFLVPLTWGPEDERVGAVRVDDDALYEAQLRYLAERGLLEDWEISELAAKAEEPYEAPDGVHRPRRRFDAVLDGLADRERGRGR